jgi:serine protease AprX
VQYSTPQPCGGCLPVNLLGGTSYNNFSLLNGLAATVQTNNVESLANQSNVTYVSPDRPLVGALDYTTQAVYAQQAWNMGLRGNGIGIAVIDSGIYNHPDLNMQGFLPFSRVVYRQSFVSGGVLYDDYGHGTHVAGIVAGNGASSQVPGSTRLLSGIAPDANLLDLRVLDQNGNGSDSAVIAAIEQAVNLRYFYNVRVINLSLGRPIYESCTVDPLCQAVEAAWKAGIVVVVSAGNLGRNGYASITAPGNSPHAITVGCMKTMGTYPRNDDLVASYSSKGPAYIDMTTKPDLVAPGNTVVSPLDPGSTLEAQFPANVMQPSYYGGSSKWAGYVFSAQRDQHGGGGGLRDGRDHAAAESLPEPRYRESAADADGHEDFPGDQHGYRSRDGQFLRRHLRHVHDWRRLSGHRGGVGQHGNGAGDRRFAHSGLLYNAGHDEPDAGFRHDLGI